jgi:pyruvate/2-oxoacid:ferredoxin oxidoreductase alpha subunit
VSVEHYRTIDAEYALIGLRQEIGSFARNTVNALRSEGVRAGVVIVADFEAISREMFHLLAQTKAVGVVEASATRSQLADWLSKRFEAAAFEYDWPASSLIPRVYSAVPATARIILQPKHLTEFVKAMREYAPDRQLLLEGGGLKPALSINDPSQAAEIVAKEAKPARPAGHFASVA